ncbi:MAG TPA: hypothetical protein PKC39_01905 [Ferruginibacter sp.]|nr:hypothetical protein [Ferruginibacter sp.]HMP19690.1 hypothetical protein [Ferruginibacter sp.]
MKTLLLSTALLLAGFTSNAQICASSFKRNNGNGTCGSEGQLRLTFPGGCPNTAPIIDSVYTNGSNSNVVFAAPDVSKCNGNNGYVSYCVVSGNMPPANVWKIYFRMPNGNTYDCIVADGNISVLPVRFVSFTAATTANGVNLRWVTAEEMNNSHYELQRSYNGTDFKTIAYMMSAEEGSNHAVYSYNDKQAVKGTVYYRIMQVDNDGKFTFSPVALVKAADKMSENNFSIYPSVFSSKLTVQLKADNNTEADIKMLTLGGQQVAAQKVKTTQGNNNIIMDNITGIPAGAYIVQVYLNGSLAGVQKVVKQ